MADHSQQFSHDMINRYLAGERIRPRLVWEHGCKQNKDMSSLMTPFCARNIVARRQYSGNAKGVINGIGVVSDVRPWGCLMGERSWSVYQAVVFLRWIACRQRFDDIAYTT